MRCHYCGVVVHAKRHNSPQQLTRDHVMPQSRGGTQWVICCLGCNRDKGALTLAEWRLVLSWRYHTVCLFAFERARIRVMLTTWMPRLACI